MAIITSILVKATGTTLSATASLGGVLAATTQSSSVAATASVSISAALSGALFTGSITGNALSVLTVQSGVISIGMPLTSVGGVALTAGTYITSGSGLSWFVNNSQTVPLQTIAGTCTTMAKLFTSAVFRNAVTLNRATVSAGLSSVANIQVSSRLSSNTRCSVSSSTGIKITGNLTSSISTAVGASVNANTPGALNSFTLFQTSNGLITGNIQHSGGASGVSGGIGQISGTYLTATYYVANPSTTPTVTIRPSMAITGSPLSIVANGTSTCTFSSIPSGTTYSVNGGTATAISGTTLGFTATTPGSYPIEFDNFPNLPSNFTVTAS